MQQKQSSLESQALLLFYGCTLLPGVINDRIKDLLCVNTTCACAAGLFYGALQILSLLTRGTDKKRTALLSTKISLICRFVFGALPFCT